MDYTMTTGIAKADAKPGTPGRTRSRTRRIMLVSADASARNRQDAAAGLRPTPEYVALERDYGVELLDWSNVIRPPTQRTPAGSIRQVGTALVRSRGVSTFLSDGEHLGLPLAQALALRPRRPGHVVIAHHLTTPTKRRLLALPGLAGAVDSFVVHSQAQVDALVGEAGLSPDQVRLVRYGVDTQFWSGDQMEEDASLVVSPGREHRDHVTLAAAMNGLDARAFVTDGSSHSAAARRRVPDVWPRNIERGSVSLDELRGLYARAALVVIPLVATDFPAGITVAVEAMAMGKPVVISGTVGLRGALADEASVVGVPPDDPVALREAIGWLLADKGRRRELGQRASHVAREHHDVRHFARALHDLMDEAGRDNG